MKKLEGYGLILILLSFGWQMLEQDLSNLSTTVDKYQIHEKLDKIYMITSDIYSQSELSKSKNEPYTSADFSEILKNWKDWGYLEKEKETVNWQLEFSMVIRSIVFIIGSVLLIIPKFNSTNSSAMILERK